jgi:hypothetical protein
MTPLVIAVQESHFGPKRTLLFALPMSAFGGKADTNFKGLHFRF